MHSTTNTAPQGGFRNSLRRGEAWLDAKGKWAWIAFTVLGFVINPFLGLAILAYLIWGKQMFARSCGQRRHAHDHSWGRHAMRAGQPTGNRAFDDYKAEALRRLEEEQEAFEAFLERLRASKDKTEFDSFMEERARATAAQDVAQTEARPEPGARPSEY
ncbi:DUF2852 domain-containing protein [Tabrizicola flagellatus]|uniref:DUF2852 domain-containing protein n=1 Tax=Tabrizicola flagellatus TaxID=2593021 RepID=UPI0011F35D52|nr:DUF2852 domain-containing protein [Tabrizicola flagellatus]